MTRFPLILRLTACLLALMTLFSPALAQEDWDYDQRCLYAQQLFGFEDRRDQPYLPAMADPVNYRGYIAMTGGQCGEDYITVYGSWDEEAMRGYLDYLAAWGYTVAPFEDGLPDTLAWSARSAQAEDIPHVPMSALKVYHIPRHDLMAISWPYLDGWMMDAWVEDSLRWGSTPVQALPAPFQLPVDERLILVEEAFVLQEVGYLAPQPPSLDPYGWHAWMPHLALMSARDTCAGVQHVLRTAEEDIHMLCLRLRCPEGTMPALRLALADREPLYADCVDMPMLTAGSMREICGVPTLVPEENSSELFALFPPCYGDAWMEHRLYLLPGEEDMTPDLQRWQRLDFSMN